MGQSQSTQHDSQTFDAERPIDTRPVDSEYAAAPKQGCCGAKKEKDFGKDLTQGLNVQSTVVSLDHSLAVSEEANKKALNDLKALTESRRAAQAAEGERSKELIEIKAAKSNVESQLAQAEKDKAELVRQNDTLNQKLQEADVNLKDAYAHRVNCQIALENLRTNLEEVQSNAEMKYFQLESLQLVEKAQLLNAREELARSSAALATITEQNKALLLEKDRLTAKVLEMEHLLPKSEESEKAVVQVTDAIHATEDVNKIESASTMEESTKVQETLTGENPVDPITVSEAPGLEQ